MGKCIWAPTSRTESVKYSCYSLFPLQWSIISIYLYHSKTDKTFSYLRYSALLELRLGIPNTCGITVGGLVSAIDFTWNIHHIAFYIETESYSDEWHFIPPLSCTRLSFGSTGSAAYLSHHIFFPLLQSWYKREFYQIVAHEFIPSSFCSSPALATE